MKKTLAGKRILGLLAALLLLQPVLCHYKARYHVIVDTDGGLDDFRAICMMLASPEIEIVAVTAVDGVLPPAVTAGKVRSLLRQFGHEGIPVGVGLPIAGKPGGTPGGAGYARKLSWGKYDTLSSGSPSAASGSTTSASTSHSGTDVHTIAHPETSRPGTNPSETNLPETSFPGSTLPGAVSLILESVELEEMPVDIVALGPMTNLATVLREDPGIPGKIRQVYWYGTAGDKQAFNYAQDPGSAREVLSSAFGICRVHAEGNTLGSPDDFLGGLDTLSTRYAAAVRDLYRSAPADFEDHYMATHLSDDCVPLYMLYPEYFTVTSISARPKRSIAGANPGAVLSAPILAVLDSDREDKSIIFSRFPADPALLEEDVAAIAGKIIERHGLKEWKLVVLTNEFHEHLGIYSILGAKMGLRAREYFHLGIDELTIVSFAGNLPPLSCMNDGLQASTGATLGHGTIRISDGETLPRARFAFKNRVIQLTVRPEIRQQIRKNVRHGVQAYGLESTEYWDYIRELALGYWLDLSRYEIFEIEELPSGD